MEGEIFFYEAGKNALEKAVLLFKTRQNIKQKLIVSNWRVFRNKNIFQKLVAFPMVLGHIISSTLFFEDLLYNIFTLLYIDCNEKRIEISSKVQSIREGTVCCQKMARRQNRSKRGAKITQFEAVSCQFVKF